MHPNCSRTIDVILWSVCAVGGAQGGAEHILRGAGATPCPPLDTPLCMTSSRSCIPFSLNHKSDFGGLEKWCSAVEIKYILMFIHVYFVLCVHMKRRSVHVCCLNWGATAICHDTLKSHKRVFIVWISLKMTKLFKERWWTMFLHKWRLVFRCNNSEEDVFS